GGQIGVCPFRRCIPCRIPALNVPLNAALHPRRPCKKCFCYKRARQPTRKLQKGVRPSRYSHLLDFLSSTLSTVTPARPSSDQTLVHTPNWRCRFLLAHNFGKALPCGGNSHAHNLPSVGLIFQALRPALKVR